MVDVSNNLVLPLVIIPLAVLTWFFQRFAGRNRNDRSHPFFHVDCVVGLFALFTLVFFIVYIIVAWASLLSNLSMLRSHEYFQFFRDSVDQSDQDAMFENRKVQVILLIAFVFSTIGAGIMYNLAFYVNRRGRTEGRTWPDWFFICAAISTCLTFIPYYYQYKYGAPTRLIPPNRSGEDSHYLDPTSVTPKGLVKQWDGSDDSNGVGSNLVVWDLTLICICILLDAHVFTRLLMVWRQPNIPQNNGGEEGNELQALGPGGQQDQGGQPVPPAPAATSSNVARAPGQQGPPSERNPSSDSHEVRGPQRLARASHPGSNRFQSEHDIDSLRGQPPPPYNPTI
ncbi:MAG: hypothetical protein M1821_001708 [Bathelium mastoideum]|nr:MAG: hypothetical protein M1821_001708 [Bathelium mastoideum]